MMPRHPMVLFVGVLLLLQADKFVHCCCWCCCLLFVFRRQGLRQGLVRMERVVDVVDRCCLPFPVISCFLPWLIMIYWWSSFWMLWTMIDDYVVYCVLVLLITFIASSKPSYFCTTYDVDTAPHNNDSTASYVACANVKWAHDFPYASRYIWY